MKSKSMILMVVSLGFGLVAAIGISKVMGGSSGPDKPAVKTGPVLVATSQFDHGTLLTEENIKVEDWPLQIIPENAMTDIEDVKDRLESICEETKNAKQMAQAIGAEAMTGQLEVIHSVFAAMGAN